MKTAWRLFLRVATGSLLNSRGVRAVGEIRLVAREVHRTLMALTIVTMAVLEPGIALADRWYEDYERAVTLIGDNSCSREALRLLGAAVVDKPKPRLGARTIAVKTIDYVPYYQLARAHLACGDTDSARHYLETSRERGIAPANLLDALERRLEEIESLSTQGDDLPVFKAEELATLVREVNSTVRQARTLAAQINVVRGERRFTELFNVHANLLERAAEDLESAEEQLNDGTLRRDRAAIDRAAEAASRSFQAYSRVNAEITTIRQTPPTATPFVLVPTATATPILTSPHSPEPAVARPTPTATLTAPKLESPTLPKDPREVAGPLRRAAANYLKADYRMVLRGLSPNEFSATHERAAAYLLRAAAHFALYCLGGRTDDETLDDARRDLQRSLDVKVSLQPDPRFFSPEFVTLFRTANRVD